MATRQPAIAPPEPGGLGLANRALPGWAGPGRAEPTRQLPHPCPPCRGSVLLPRSMLTGEKVAPPPGPKAQRRGCPARSAHQHHPAPLSPPWSRVSLGCFKDRKETHCSTRHKRAAPHSGRHRLPWDEGMKPTVSTLAQQTRTLSVQLAWPCPPLFPCSLGGPGSPLLQGALPPPPAHTQGPSPSCLCPLPDPAALSSLSSASAPGPLRQRDLISPKSPWSRSDKSQALLILSSGAHSPLRPWDSGLRTPIRPPPTLPPQSPREPLIPHTWSHHMAPGPPPPPHPHPSPTPGSGRGCRPLLCGRQSLGCSWGCWKPGVPGLSLPCKPAAPPNCGGRLPWPGGYLEMRETPQDDIGRGETATLLPLLRVQAATGLVVLWCFGQYVLFGGVRGPRWGVCVCVALSHTGPFSCSPDLCTQF